MDKDQDQPTLAVVLMEGAISKTDCEDPIGGAGNGRNGGEANQRVGLGWQLLGGCKVLSQEPCGQDCTSRVAKVCAASEAIQGREEFAPAIGKQ